MRWHLKYPVQVKLGGDLTRVTMPAGATNLHFGFQHFADFNVWASVPVSQADEEYLFLIVGTGHPIHSTDGFEFLQTCVRERDGLVWHIYGSKENGR